jgi:hypothetical protein
MSFKLRDYQEAIIKEGSKKLLRLRIIMLAMQVRCGKTLTAFGIAENVNARCVLFITKKKVIISKTIHDDYNLLKPSFDWDIINYESVHKMEPKKYDLVIIDESHSLGAFPKPSNRTKRIREIIGNKLVILLSGTPTPESWSQIYHQFWISQYSPFAEQSFYKWASNYVNIKKRYVAHGNQVNDYSQARIKEIQRILSKYIITYTQKEAGFSSEITEHCLYVQMKPTTYQLVEHLEKHLVYEGKKGGLILGDTAVKLMQKVHQIYSGTIKLEDGSARVIDDSKAIYIKDRFKFQKIGIFYKFKEELNLLQQVFGDQLTTDIHEFNNSNKNIALQIQSGREGISLKKADAIVFLNIDFSATSYWQARDRMTTKDRLNNHVYWIFSKGGLEDKIYKTVLDKKSFTTKHYEKERSLVAC